MERREKLPRKKVEEEPESSTSESSSEEDSDSESDTESTSSSEEQEPEEKDEQPEGKQEVDDTDKPIELTGTPLEIEVKKVLLEMRELGTYATWSNLECAPRIALLEFLTNMLLKSKAAQKSAEDISHTMEADVQAFERKLKELREQFEQDLKKINRKEEDFNERKDALTKKFEKQSAAAFSSMQTKWTKDDIGCRIKPIGRDRYRRLYWLFPQEKRVLVQTVPNETADFPVAAKAPSSDQAKKVSLFDNEESVKEITQTPRKTSSASTQDRRAAQRVWGYLSPEDLAPFIETLETRGVRECALSKELTNVLTFIEKLDIAQEGIRMTRSRCINNGFVNRFRLTD